MVGRDPGTASTEIEPVYAVGRDVSSGGTELVPDWPTPGRARRDVCVDTRVRRSADAVEALFSTEPDTALDVRERRARRGLPALSGAVAEPLEHSTGTTIWW